MLKLEDCTAAKKLLPVLDAAYTAQAYEQGVNDARTFHESRLSQSAHPLWRDGYELGFANEMSAIADRKEEHERED